MVKKSDIKNERGEEQGMKAIKKGLEKMASSHKKEMKSEGLKAKLKKGGKVSPKKGKK